MDELDPTNELGKAEWARKAGPVPPVEKDDPEAGIRIAEFLSQLGDLTKRTGIIIGGCGCEGSPWLVVPGIVATLDDLTWNPDTQAYSTGEE